MTGQLAEGTAEKAVADGTVISEILEKNPELHGIAATNERRGRRANRDGFALCDGIGAGARGITYDDGRELRRRPSHEKNGAKVSIPGGRRLR